MSRGLRAVLFTARGWKMDGLEINNVPEKLKEASRGIAHRRRSQQFFSCYIQHKWTRQTRLSVVCQRPPMYSWSINWVRACVCVTCHNSSSKSIGRWNQWLMQFRPASTTTAVIEQPVSHKWRCERAQRRGAENAADRPTSCTRARSCVWRFSGNLEDLGWLWWSHEEPAYGNRRYVKYCCLLLCTPKSR